MDVDTAKKLLRDKGIAIIGDSRLGNETGTQIRLAGAVVSVYDKGTFQVQGGDHKLVGSVKEILGHSAPTSKSPVSNKIFVVYGHDEKAKVGIENLLRRWGLEPLLLDQKPAGGNTIIENLERYTGEVEYAVVLVTPDDEGHRACRPEEKSFRARQNVVLELGMMIALLGRERVAILIKKADKMEKPSDTHGLLYISFEDIVDDGEAKIKLLKELNEAGYNIPPSKL